jgi:DNA-binding GntR family transcriptional regulator
MERSRSKRASVGSAPRAALHIRRQIFDGTLQPGRRVPSTAIAAQLGISRIPVREALIGLEREGWVTIRHNRGATVNAMSENTVRDHFELYGATYGLAARRAIERAGEDRALAREVAARARDLPSDDDPVGFTKHALELNNTVVDAAHSDRIRLVLQALSTIIPGPFFEYVPDAMPIQRKGFKRLAAAFASGDADRAASEYETMMRRVGEIVTRMFRDRGLVEDDARAGT